MGSEWDLGIRISEQLKVAVKWNRSTGMIGRGKTEGAAEEGRVTSSDDLIISMPGICSISTPIQPPFEPFEAPTVWIVVQPSDRGQDILSPSWEAYTPDI